jgi:hypothetical protein
MWVGAIATGGGNSVDIENAFWCRRPLALGE